MLSEQRTVRAVRTKAENLPSGLDKTYDDVMERISKQAPADVDLAFKVLSWVTYAKRPLKPEELQYAVATAPGMTSLDDDDLTDVEDLLSFCAGIAIVDRESNVVRLVHYTTQGFLEDRLTDRKVDVPRACLSYLEVPLESILDNYSYSIGVNVDKLYPLLDYARMYWADHIRGHSEDQLKTDCLRAVSGHGIRVLLSDPCRYREIPTFNGQDIIQLLPICAAYGLAGFCRELLGSDKYVPLQES